MTAEIDWMGGAVPPSWQAYKLKYVLREEHKSVGEDLPAGAISFGEVVYKDFDNEETLATYRTVRRGQFLINPLNLNYDLKSLRIGLSEIDCRVSPAYIVASADESISNASYLRWALRVFDVQHIKTLGAGVRQTVKFEDIGACRIALPSLDQQEVIASRLSSETSRIDALVAKKTRFIELLREKRQALITQAVTKGLDPSVPMKDSGVEWLGEIPTNWTATRVRFLASKIGSGKTPSGGGTVYVDQGTTFLRSQNVYDDGIRLDDVVFITADIHEEMAVSKVKPWDVLLNITGGSIGRAALVPEDFAEANVNQHVCIVRVGSPLLARWVHMCFRAMSVKDQIDALQTGANREGLNFEQVGNLRIALPPPKSIAETLDALNQILARVELLIAKTERSIELLREHRTALITAAVTGKIDLRDAA